MSENIKHISSTGDERTTHAPALPANLEWIKIRDATAPVDITDGCVFELGLVPGAETPDYLRVSWPSGKVQHYTMTLDDAG